MPDNLEAIIIGGSYHGLVCAAYLAKQGSGVGILCHETTRANHSSLDRTFR